MAKSGERGRRLNRGVVIDLHTLVAGVYWAQRVALRRGMIPIAGVMSREVGRGRHEVLGVGWNHLAEGVPGSVCRTITRPGSKETILPNPLRVDFSSSFNCSK